MNPILIGYQLAVIKKHIQSVVILYCSNNNSYIFFVLCGMSPGIHYCYRCFVCALVYQCDGS